MSQKKPALQPAGVAMLLFQGSKDHDARLTVPNIEEDRPGIRCTDGGDGSVLMEAVGWESNLAAMGAIWRAVDVVLDAGLATEGVMPGESLYPARRVRRR